MWFDGADGETNACQTASHHARCSASSATSMPTATGSSARRRLRLLRTTRPRHTVSVTGHKRRAPTPAAPPFSARDLQARHNAAKEKKKTVKSKPVGQGEQPVSNAEEPPAAAKPNVNPASSSKGILI